MSGSWTGSHSALQLPWYFLSPLGLMSFGISSSEISGCWGSGHKCLPPTIHSIKFNSIKLGVSFNIHRCPVTQLLWVGPALSPICWWPFPLSVVGWLHPWNFGQGIGSRGWMVTADSTEVKSNKDGVPIPEGRGSRIRNLTSHLGPYTTCAIYKDENSRGDFECLAFRGDPTFLSC